MRFVRGVSNQRAAASRAIAVALLAGAQAAAQAPATAQAAPAAAQAPATAPPALPAQAPEPGPPRAALAATNPSSAPAVDQPRPFGYVLGDTLTQRVLLARDFQPESLPPIERAGLWFARRSSKIQRTDDDGQWLIMEYQLVNAPQTLITVNLPVVTLKAKSGAVLTVPEWSISVAPLTPRAVFAKGGLQELRSDHPAPLLPTSALQRQLKIWLGAFAVTVLAWFGWWLVRSIQAAANQPFARALREVRRAGNDSVDAWLALHRAFDRTVGRALQTSTLPVLFKLAPHFESERVAIEQFYNQSNLRFFGVAPTPIAHIGSSSGRVTPASEPAQANTDTNRAQRAQPHVGAAIELRAFAATLRRLEKQHER